MFFFVTGRLDNPPMSSTPPSTGTVEFALVVPLYVVASCIEVWLLIVAQPTREAHIGIRLINHYFQMLLAFREIKRAQMNQGI